MICPRSCLSFAIHLIAKRPILAVLLAAMIMTGRTELELDSIQDSLQKGGYLVEKTLRNFSSSDIPTMARLAVDSDMGGDQKNVSIDSDTLMERVLVGKKEQIVQVVRPGIDTHQPTVKKNFRSIPELNEVKPEMSKKVINLLWTKREKQGEIETLQLNSLVRMWEPMTNPGELDDKKMTMRHPFSKLSMGKIGSVQTVHQKKANKESASRQIANKRRHIASK